MLARQHSQLSEPGLSELIVPAWQETTAELTMPMLAHLSHQSGNRWLTWIGSKLPSKTELDAYGFNQRTLRLMRSKDDAENLWMMWETLNTGTSAFVVAFFDDKNCRIHRQERSHLEQACYSGNARALLIQQPSTS
ncbi:hypothetical protein [Agaribacterium sp. ZY112]|uniref:hypothetical protein n=1 Tax=Agaribacterium sp. ZY112 TaxID=3233574 RepID=UPI0035232194